MEEDDSSYVFSFYQKKNGEEEKLRIVLDKKTLNCKEIELSYNLYCKKKEEAIIQDPIHGDIHGSEITEEKKSCSLSGIPDLKAEWDSNRNLFKIHKESIINHLSYSSYSKHEFSFPNQNYNSLQTYELLSISEPSSLTIIFTTP